MINQRIKLNLIPGYVNERINVSQYDVGSRALQFEIYNGEVPYNLTSGLSIIIQGTKPDKHGFQYNATYTSGTNLVTANLTQQMAIVAGEVTCELVINGGSGSTRLATANFILAVEPAALGNEALPSDSDLPAIIALATEQMENAEAWAEGTVNGVPVPSTAPQYHNNSKYYSESIGVYGHDAEAWAVGTKGGTPVASTDAQYHNNSKYYSQQAGTSATSASGSATTATNQALKSEGYAVGQQNGTDVGSGSTYYHNNAKYYKEQAASSATSAASSASTATTKASNASTSATSAAGSATLAQSYAKGGTSSRTGEDTDNAKYYKEQAASSASTASTKATQASTSATNAATSASTASTASSSASTNALKAEGYAVGKQNGSAVSSGSTYYHNNAQYYSQQAAASASAAEAWSAHPPYIGANGNWWVFNTTSNVYVDSGVDASITITIADITMIADDATPYVTNTGTQTDPIFHLFVPRGRGIASVTKISTSGLVDTYRITYTDGLSTTYTVANGRGVVSITKTGTSGLEDTYTIAFNDGGSTTYKVINGRGISTFAKTSTSGLVDTYTITYNDSNTSTFTITNGKTAYMSAVEGGYAESEERFESDLANFGTWASSASADAATASQAASDAVNAAALAEQYADFATPHFLIENNRLYIKDDAVGEFVTANNRLYIKLVS